MEEKPLSLIEQFPQLKTRRGEEEKHACMLPRALDIIEPTSKLFPVPCPRGMHCPEQKKDTLGSWLPSNMVVTNNLSEKYPS